MCAVCRVCVRTSSTSYFWISFRYFVELLIPTCSFRLTYSTLPSSISIVNQCVVYFESVLSFSFFLYAHFTWKIFFFVLSLFQFACHLCCYFVRKGTTVAACKKFKFDAFIWMNRLSERNKCDKLNVADYSFFSSIFRASICKWWQSKPLAPPSPQQQPQAHASRSMKNKTNWIAEITILIQWYQNARTHTQWQRSGCCPKRTVCQSVSPTKPARPLNLAHHFQFSVRSHFLSQVYFRGILNFNGLQITSTWWILPLVWWWLWWWWWLLLLFLFLFVQKGTFGAHLKTETSTTDDKSLPMLTIQTFLFSFISFHFIIPFMISPLFEYSSPFLFLPLLREAIIMLYILYYGIFPLFIVYCPSHSTRWARSFFHAVLHSKCVNYISITSICMVGIQKIRKGREWKVQIISTNLVHFWRKHTIW